LPIDTERTAIVLDPDSDGAQLIDGAAGHIEVLVDRPVTPCIGAVVIAHPQPLLGGDAQHKIPHLLARALAEAGWLALRPNFRGAGRSTGTHDGGQGETEDLLELAMSLQSDSSVPRLALVGFSFGAFVQARVARRLTDLGRPAWRVGLLGMPFGEVEAGRSCDPPDGFPDAFAVHGERDERVPLSAILDWARPRHQPVVVVPGADHFFTGKLPLLRALVLDHLRP
jgi:alpha/beta superfamily hydrolase